MKNFLRRLFNDIIYVANTICQMLFAGVLILIVVYLVLFGLIILFMPIIAVIIGIVFVITVLGV